MFSIKNLSSLFSDQRKAQSEAKGWTFLQIDSNSWGIQDDKSWFWCSEDIEYNHQSDEVEEGPHHAFGKQEDV